MLIVGDLSGIQDYLFEVRETGGKQAASLRSRSLRLQVIAECIARRFLWACGLDESRLLFVAAGKFAIDADGVADADAAVSRAHADSQRWLFGHAQGRLRFAVGTEPPGLPVVDRYAAAMAALQRSKLCPWRVAAGPSPSWAEAALVSNGPWDADREAERDAEQGRRLLSAEVVTLTPAPDRPRGQQSKPGNKADGSKADLGGRDVVGVLPTWGKRADAPSEGPLRVTLDLARLSRHIPRAADGAPIEFVPLASRSRGDALLGVLKADADSLGAAIHRQLTGAADLTPLRSLSKKLEEFFGAELEGMMSAPGSPGADLYTIFSGGDDILLVGPWNVAIDFAAQVRRAFAKSFRDEKLTISAGLALVKPRFPIRLAAEQAEELLEQAKSRPAKGDAAPKDQFAALGGCWKWWDHDRVIGAGKQLAGWVDAGAIERGWLHTLLELTLLQRSTPDAARAGPASRTGSTRPAATVRGPATPAGHDLVRPTPHARSQDVTPAMAGSRLAYHVARNWPKHGPARQWVEALRLHFDQYPHTTDPVTVHLPSVLRYALLATRSPSGKE